MKRGEVTKGSAWALVTGAGSGIGRCFALRLARLGYRLVLVGNDLRKLECVRAELRALDAAEVRIISCDLARAEAAQELYDRLRAAGIAVDVLINNAGIFSFRDKFHQWDPKNQRPELWDIYNTRINKGESIRVFPLSNWTELDIWQYIRLENIPIVPLYFAKERPVVNIDGNLIMPDDDRLPEQYRDKIEMRMVRFRTLGCWPLTGAVESEADTIEKIVEEMMTTTKSERTTRVIDFDQEASMEQKKREGYF